MSVLIRDNSIILDSGQVVLEGASNCPCCEGPCTFTNGLPKPQCCCDIDDPEYCGPGGICTEPPFDDPPDPCDSVSCPSLDLTSPALPIITANASPSAVWLHPAGTGTSSGACTGGFTTNASLNAGNYEGLGNWSCPNAWTTNIGTIRDIDAGLFVRYGCIANQPYTAVTVNFRATGTLLNLSLFIVRQGSFTSISGVDASTNGPYTVLESSSGFISPIIYCGRPYGYTFQGTMTLRPANPASTGRKTLTGAGTVYTTGAHPPFCCSPDGALLLLNPRESKISSPVQPCKCRERKVRL